MDRVLVIFAEFALWVEAVTPRGPLLVLPFLAVVWLVAWRLPPRYNASPVAALVRLWTAMLGLSSAALLSLWAIGSYTADHLPLSWHRPTSNILFLIALAGPAHALRATLTGVLSKRGGSSQLKHVASGAAWILFSGIMLLCLHDLLMTFAFPWGGGEFHAMFAHTSEGRLKAALRAWRASVLILGLCTLVFSVWIPLRWWIHALLAITVGVHHWWAVCTWEPQSPGFHQAAMWLLLAMPVTILLLSGAAAWLGHRWQTRHHRHPPRASE